MNEVTNLNGLQESKFRLSGSAAKALSLKIYPAGSITFPKRGGAIATNKKRQLLVSGALDLNLMVLTATGVRPGFLWWWMQNLDLATISNGSTVPQINNGDIEPLQINIPSEAEQDEITRRITDAFFRINTLEAEGARADVLLDRLESAILAKAFRGELVPQDPTDEPASITLDRIRAQRLAAPASKRGRSAKVVSA
jgi:type I restriction enzyme S subunit